VHVAHSAGGNEALTIPKSGIVNGGMKCPQNRGLICPLFGGGSVRQDFLTFTSGRLPK